jgi:hypothetical protein
MKRLAIAIVAAAALAIPGGAWADTPREAVVEQLYRDFPTENPTRFIKSTPVRVLQRYFTPQLANLLHADYVCGIREQGICHLDFDPIYDSQDPEARELQVIDGTEVKVRFKRTNGGREETVTIRCRMERIKAGWRIDDFIYPNGVSLRAILSRN